MVREVVARFLSMSKVESIYSAVVKRAPEAERELPDQVRAHIAGKGLCQVSASEVFSAKREPENRIKYAKGSEGDIRESPHTDVKPLVGRFSSTRSSTEPEASRWFPILPCSTSPATWSSSSPGAAHRRTIGTPQGSRRPGPVPPSAPRPALVP